MKITMVLADDEAFALKSEEMFIRREFPEIEIAGTAEDGIELKEMLERLDPDIAMIDIHMPGLSGLEVAELLSHQGTIHTHFIVHTAYSDFDYIKRALNLKMDGYLLKPSKREEKLETVGRLCRLVEEEKKSREEREALSDVISRVNPVLGSEVLQSIFSGSCDEAGFRRYCEINQIAFRCGCVAAFLPKGNCRLERETADPAIREVLGDLCGYLSTVTDTGIVLMILLEREQDPEAGRSLSEDLAFLTAQRLEAVYGQKFVYGVGGCYPQFDQMPRSYRESIRQFETAVSGGAADRKGENSEKAEAYLDSAKKYIRSNFCRDISLSDCAEATGISPYYLSHLFRETSGGTFIEYLSGVRVEEAKRLAVETGLTIRELGERVGYQNTAYFCKVFKRMAGCTIGEYRKNQGKQSF